MYTLTQVKKGIVRNLFCFVIGDYFFINKIKAKMKMLGRELHTVNDAVFVK